MPVAVNDRRVFLARAFEFIGLDDFYSPCEEERFVEEKARPWRDDVEQRLQGFRHEDKVRGGACWVKLSIGSFGLNGGLKLTGPCCADV